MGKQKKSTIISLVSAGLLVGTLAFTSITGAAGAASLTLSPASGSYNVNSTFTVTVYENSGTEAVDSASADVRYDASKLQYVSHSFAGGAFDLCVASVPSGTVNLGCTRSSGTVTGNKIVGKVTFKARVGSGSTPVTFDPSSAIIRSDGTNIWNGNTSGGTYSLKTPPPPPAPPAPSPSPSPTPAAPSPASPSPTPGTPPPAPGQPSPSPANPPTDIAAQEADPGNPVLVNKPVASGSGNLVAIKVTDRKGKLLANATVTLDGQTVTSDDTGIASFINVVAGEHEVKVESASGSIQSKVTVVGGNTSGEIQEFEIALVASNTSPVWQITSGVAIVLGLAGAALFAWRHGVFRAFTNKRMHPAGTSSSGLNSQTFSPDHQVITPDDKPSTSSNDSSGSSSSTS